MLELYAAKVQFPDDYLRDTGAMQPDGEYVRAGPGVVIRSDPNVPNVAMVETAGAAYQTLRHISGYRETALPRFQHFSPLLSPLSILATSVELFMSSQSSSPILTLPERTLHQYFSDEDADVIIRSSDDVHFKMYKVVLSKASPFFKDMFSLPQSPHVVDDRASDFIDGVPVVDLTEKSRTLDFLFSFSYPCPNPELKSLDDVHVVLEAANKYQMEDVILYARRSWNELSALDPLRAFAIACNRHWEEEAHAAALLSLREPVWPLEPPMAPEFRHISADTAIRLMSYQRRCGMAAKNAALDIQWTNGIFDASSCTHCLGSFTMTQTRRIRDWFALYAKQVAPHLQEQPSGLAASKRSLVDSSIHQVFDIAPCDVEMHCIERIRQIVQVFSDEIDKVVAQVRLNAA